MKLLNVNELLAGEQLLADTGLSRALSLVLEPGQEHRFSSGTDRDRWLLVLSGEGLLTGPDGDEKAALGPAGLGLVTAGEPCVLRAREGDEPLVMLCFEA
ncbi:hypothetical protein [Alkalilimnicola sp. S0819]|uniref:hypothetical protein n=1 Tax=Alkalilimnicola sp. S0819 TaxID=2613922 RepID=UPI001261D462|nr:hypothetical protein [Alkalilimnicola sp. S0819]KAB7628450.1 hypothetical protein F3N43_01775 [Alkalilimnicola sp. S0819]MPQ15355.1 hypothetical protein [Alkalilimnicola sp. S0819]